MSRKIKFLVGFTFILILVSVVYHFYSRKPVGVETTASDYTLESDSILHEFFLNPASASDRYNGKLLTIIGWLQQVDTLGTNTTLILGSKRFKSSIRCSMDSIITLNAFSLPVASRIHIKGICTGYNKDDLLGNDLILNRCILLNESFQ